MECKRCKTHTTWHPEGLCEFCYDDYASEYWQWCEDSEPDVPFAEHLDVINFWD